MKPPLCLLLAAVLTLGACREDPPPQPQRPAVPSVEETAQERVAELEDDNHYLREQLRHQDEFVGEYSNMINGLLGHLQAIAAGEDQVLAIAGAMDIETGYRRVDYETEINEILSAIDRRLGESRKAEEDLEKLLEASEKESQRFQKLLEATDKERQEFQATVGQLRQTVEGLRALVAEKELRIKELRLEVKELIEELERQTGLTEKYRKAAWGHLLVAAETRLKELRRSDVLRKPLTKKRLEVAPKALVEGRYEESFERVDATATILVLSPTARKGEVRSLHKRRPDLVQIAVVDGELIARIKDPQAFWGISRFLIVQVD